MPTKVVFSISGLVVCFIDKSEWNAVFICDANHRLKFTHPLLGEKYLWESGQDINVELSCENFVKNISAPGTDFENVFNLSRKSVHGVNPIGRSNLKRRDRASKKKDLVWIRVPFSKLNVTAKNTDDYWFQEVKPTLQNPLSRKEVASAITVELDVEDDLTIRAYYDKFDTFKGTFPGKPGAGPIYFDLNNHCDPECTYNDFVNLYDFVIDESSGSERQFLAGKLKVDTSNVPFKNEQGILVVSDEHGNCDPSVINPPPGD